jgi:LPS sulfotransferase NodH
MSGGRFVWRFQVTPFVILFVERAGSTYLITALKSHPSVLALTEKLCALRLEGKGAADQLQWAEAFLTPPLVGRHRAIGFKTKLVDVLDRDGFAELLRRRKCRIVQLRRRNVVKGAVSTLNARRQWEKSGNWNLLNETTRLPPFSVDPARFDALLHEREQLDRELEGYVDALQLPTLRLFYEDLLRNQQTFVRKTLDFLGSRDQPVLGTTLKNTGDNLSETLLNFDDLRTRYAGTRYESMFDEVLVPA